MKRLILIALMMTSAAFAEVITVLETQVPRTFGYTTSSAKFHMDTQTGMGYADVLVTEEDRTYYPGPPTRCDRWGCYPGPQPIPRIRTVLSERVEIQGLNLVNKEMIFDSENGPVNCGYLGTSRVLRRPTLYLSGNCKLRSSLRGSDLIVTFKAQ